MANHTLYDMKISPLDYEFLKYHLNVKTYDDESIRKGLSKARGTSAKTDRSFAVGGVMKHSESLRVLCHQGSEPGSQGLR